MDRSFYLFGPRGELLRVARRVGFISPAARELGDVYDYRVVPDGPVDGVVAASAVSSDWLAVTDEEEAEARARVASAQPAVRGEG